MRGLTSRALGVALVWCAVTSLQASDGARQPATVVAALIDAAEPGSTVLVPPGIYEGNLVVRKAITLDGGSKAIFDGLGKGTVIEFTRAPSTIRNCIIRNSGEDVTGESAALRAVAGPIHVLDNRIEDSLFGIDLREAPDSVIRGNDISCKALDPERRGDGIRLWWSHGCVVEANVVRSSRDMVFWYSENLRVRENRVSNGRYGLHFMYSHDTVLESNVLDGNSVGVYLMYSNRITLVGNRMINNRGASGYGIGLKDCDDIVIDRNAVLANRVGVYVDNSPSSQDSTGWFRDNLFAFNEIGLLATPNTHDNVFVRNAFIENEEPAATHGRGQLTLNSFSHEGRGNYWSDYAGFDLDRDGVGDLAFEPRSLFGAMLSREPNLRLFVHSPAQRAIEFTARALPELQPPPTLVDPTPLSRPPAMALAIEAERGSPWAMAWLSGALMGLASATVAVLGRERSIRHAEQGATT